MQLGFINLGCDDIGDAQECDSLIRGFSVTHFKGGTAWNMASLKTDFDESGLDWRNELKLLTRVIDAPFHAIPPLSGQNFGKKLKVSLTSNYHFAAFKKLQDYLPFSSIRAKNNNNLTIEKHFRSSVNLCTFYPNSELALLSNQSTYH